MKNTKASIILSILTYISAFSQPIINSNDITPISGEEFNLMVCSYITPQAGMTNATWDYSGVSDLDNITRKALLPTNTKHASSFLNSSVAIQGSDSVYIFFLSTSDSLINQGLYTETSVLAYTDVEKLFEFPLTYNKSHTDNWNVNYQSSGFDNYRKGTTSVLIDGYGQLSLPGQTYTDVLRVHITQNYTDSLFVGVPVLINYTNEEYRWYKAGIHWPVLTTSDLSINGTHTITSTYLTNNPNAVGQELNPNNINIYPNPTKNVVYISYNKNNNLSYKITSATGADVAIEPTSSFANNLKEFNFSNQASGIYFITIYSEQHYLFTKKIMIQH